MTGKDRRDLSAREVLNTYSFTALQQIAARQELAEKPRSKEKMVTELARTLYDPARIKRALMGLEPLEREVLDRLIGHHGLLSIRVLREQLEAEGKIERRPPGYGSRTAAGKTQGDKARLGDIVAALGAAGLAFTSAQEQSRDLQLQTPRIFLFVPRAILSHLPPVTLGVREAQPVAEEPASGGVLLRDLYLLASFAQQQPIPLTARGLIPKRSLVEIDAVLRLPEGAREVKAETDLARLPFLRALSEELGLLVPSMLGLALGTEAAKLLGSSPGERLRQSYEAYRRGEGWSELARLPAVTVTPRANIYHPKVVEARQRILAEVAAMPAGRWVPIEHVVDRMRFQAYEFLVSRYADDDYYNYGYSYATYSQTPMGVTFSRTTGQPDWQSVEAEFIRAVVREALYWLGVVDLGRSQQGMKRADLFRLTPLGEALLHGKTPALPAAAPQVVIQPNFQLLAFEPTGEDVLFTLDRLAQRVRAEKVVEYRITRESVYAALRGGMETAQIITFLEGIASSGLPQNVRRSIEEWGAWQERIVVRRNTPLLQTIDAQTLDALYADPEVAALLGRRVAPTAALVGREQLQALSRLLVSGGKSGHLPLPALSEGTDGWVSPEIVVQADGQIAFSQPLPSIYLRHRLRRFADEEAGGLRLTAASLRRAVQSGETPESIVDTLNQFYLGPVPDEVEAMVRVWAKDMGRGTLAEVVLLQVETPQIMAELRADPQLGRYLQPVPGAATLATVPRQHASRLRTLLEERGMELGDRLPV